MRLSIASLRLEMRDLCLALTLDRFGYHGAPFRLHFGPQLPHNDPRTDPKSSDETYN